MLTSDFDYNLPLEQIAQTPAEPRDSSKLMVVDRVEHTIKHEHFYDITQYLGAGDLVVWNNSKVFKARLRGTIVLDEAVITPSPPQTIGSPRRVRGQGEVSSNAPTPPSLRRDTSPRAGEESERSILGMPPVEIFLVRPMENKYVWKVLAKPGRRLRLGMKVRFASDFEGEVILKEEDGTILMQFSDDDMVVRAKANEYGEVPVPPYVEIKNDDLRMKNIELSERYQTVYALIEGSVAAPTAGFHFTPELIEKLKAKGVEFAEVTLHVGLGTFLSVKTKRIEEHKMHSEWVEITAKNADLINAAKQEGRRVVVVGTTTVRVLEGVYRLQSTDYRLQHEPTVVRSPIAAVVRPYSGDINIFITPGFKFNIVDALITNFHLPKSTLLMLVAAFVGDRKFTLDCYQKAIKENYRFYSFGDAMLVK